LLETPEITVRNFVSGDCMKRIIFVAGARPNFIKIAPLIHIFARDKDRFKIFLVHTGQHYDIEMSDRFFKELEIPMPDINLEVGSASHAVQTANIMIKFEQVCKTEKPDWVMVVGDVNSTVAAALVASKMGIKIAHVEAGLRSFDRTMPEEINRVVTDSLADLLFTPSLDGNENLKKEGIAESKIRMVGNIMIDTLVANLDKARGTLTHRKLGFSEKEFVYITLHRPSNVDNKVVLSKIILHLERLASQVPIVFPIHPRTKKMISSFRIIADRNSRFKIMDPIGYHESLCLIENARFVLTDSGGIQEETTFFHTPCLTLRPNTERPITIKEGTNKLTNPENLWADIGFVLNQPKRVGNIPPLWDGKTAERIVNIFKELYR
jgi:UDP-N-acetylglucosamine 2-epimerase (non-hydrolysing)